MFNTSDNDEVKSPGRGVEKYSNPDISNNGTVFVPNVRGSNVSPMAVATPNDISAEANVKVLRVSTEMSTSPNVHTVSLGSTFATLCLVEVTLIDIINIESKILAGTSCSKVSAKNILPEKSSPHAMQVSIENKTHLIHDQLVPEDNQAKEATRGDVGSCCASDRHNDRMPVLGSPLGRCPTSSYLCEIAFLELHHCVVGKLSCKLLIILKTRWSRLHCLF
mmetsp:Transcript_2720/g.4220  ORF Transcript_2720/g.4220 Transcript_2720/m.4220 type:complete len:221 (+) Transcript_2720:471-1133(+)